MLKAFNEAIEANQTPAELAALDAQLKQMEQIFDAVNEVKPDDVITLDYLPGSGTQISVNGKALGTIAGAAFNRALLKIWLGNKPVQDDLKKGCWVVDSGCSRTRPGKSISMWTMRSSRI